MIINKNCWEKKRKESRLKVFYVENFYLESAIKVAFPKIYNRSVISLRWTWTFISWLKKGLKHFITEHAVHWNIDMFFQRIAMHVHNNALNDPAIGMHRALSIHQWWWWNTSRSPKMFWYGVQVHERQMHTRNVALRWRQWLSRWLGWRSNSLQ